MEVINKPFECPNENCSLSFANEDHLVVHKKKHELSLTLTPTTPFKTLFDQTPTPTRFLNALDSSDLFQELNADNPFDATFRKANSGNGGSHNFVIPESSSLIASLPDTSEPLNTPSIILPSEPATPIILKSNFTKNKSQKEQTSQSYTENADSLPFSPNVQQSLEKTSDENTESILSVESAACALTELNAISLSAQNPVQKTCPPKSSVVQTPVITSVGNSSVLKSSATCVPTAVVTRQVTNVIPTTTQVSVVTEKPNQEKVMQQSQAAVVQSMCVTPMLQLMIRLPDGQTMPVQFPVLSTTPATAQPSQASQPVQTTQIVQPIIANENPQLSTQNVITKMKLKDMLKLNKKTIHFAKKSSPLMKTQTKLVPVQPVPSQDSLHEIELSPPPSPVTQKPAHNGRRRRDTIDDLDEKRRKSLERNRAAATRCREKRKQWITALEKKADELSVTNTQLQYEVTQLRKEVAHLKTLLLAHKDCPVTQQQKSVNYEAEEQFTTIQVITTDDLQCVPNNSTMSPVQNMEYMEVEVNSVQSSSDLSLTSDGSDSSFKER